MNQNLAQQAIDKALLGEWKEAKDVNLSILKQNPQDTDALNRLAKCYFKLGNIKTAKSTIAKILKIDSYNPIALKSFEKWKNLKKIDKNTSKHLSPEKFLEEPGKTKIIHLIHPCDDSLLAKLNCNKETTLVSLIFGEFDWKSGYPLIVAMIPLWEGRALFRVAHSTLLG